ncbi:MAG: spore coat associated protein CotJA [Ruminococcaceae bacterium]|nr:spore coat associated protein CotJA [Oscillospiraceae bacterium]
MQTHHTEKPVSCRADTEQQNTGMNGCTPEQDGVLAMAYVHVQSLGTLYDPCTALIAGTVFPSLDKPFCGDTVSASAYPNPPARTCDCALPTRRDSGCCGTRGGHDHD